MSVSPQCWWCWYHPFFGSPLFSRRECVLGWRLNSDWLTLFTVVHLKCHSYSFQNPLYHGDQISSLRERRAEDEEEQITLHNLLFSSKKPCYWYMGFVPWEGDRWRNYYAHSSQMRYPRDQWGCPSLGQLPGESWRTMKDLCDSKMCSMEAAIFRALAGKGSISLLSLLLGSWIYHKGVGHLQALWPQQSHLGNLRKSFMNKFK